MTRLSTSSFAEKAHLNVTRTICHAITYLSTALPELAAHLEESVATGVSCCYEPRTNIADQPDHRRVVQASSRASTGPPVPPLR